jgi:signal peptidase II
MRKYRIVLGVAAAILALDQLTKWYIRHTMGLYESIAVLDFFHITHIRNTGGAFGLFAGAHEAWRIPFFLLVSAAAVIALLFFVRRVEPERLLLLGALGGILGGALGNLVDRMVSGEVTDFLDFHWRGYHWPAFNVADSCITVGMIVLLLYSLLAPDAAGEEQRA